MAALPTGTVTFLFTDIEGSTRIWEREPERMRALLARHDAIVRHIVEKHGGHVFKTIGDAFCVAFHDPLEAADAAIETQQELIAAFTDFRVRAAIYTGPAVETDGDYFGPAVNRVARLLSAGHGGQILVDGASAHLIGEAHREDARLRLLGEHRLRDLQAQEKVFQVLHLELPASFPPLNTLDIAFRRGVVRAVAMSGIIVLALTGLTLVAVAQARRADKNADLALQGERRAIRGEKDAVLNAATARKETIRANREERVAKSASEQRRIALGIAVRERNKATVAADKERLAKLAEAAQKLVALYQKAEAGKQRDLALTQLVRFHVSNGDRFLESSGPVAGMPWYARVLAITKDAHKPEMNARVRLAAVLSRCPAPIGIMPHPAPFTHAAFSADGGEIAILSKLRSLQVWDARGRRLGPAHDLPALSSLVEMSPDGKFVLSGMASPYYSIPAGRLQVRAVRGGEPVSLDTPSPTAAVFSPSGNLVLAGSEEGFAAFYDPRTGKQAGPRLPHPAKVQCAAFLRGPNQAITGCEDGLLRIWDVRSGRLLKSLRGSGAGLSVLRVTPRHIIAGPIAGKLDIWDGNGGIDGATPSREIQGFFSEVTASRDGSRIATCEYTARTARVWDPQTGEPLTPPLLHPAGVLTASFNPDGTLLATSCDDGGVRFWDTTTGAPAAPPLKLSGPCLFAQFSPDGGHMFTASSNGVGRLWSGKMPRPFAGEIKRTDSLSAGLYSADGKRIVTASGAGGTTFVSDAESGRALGELASGAAPWGSLSVSADGTALITTGIRRSVRLWDATTLRPLSPLIEQPEPAPLGLGPDETVIGSLSISPGRKRLYTSFVVESGLDSSDPANQAVIEAWELAAWDLPNGQPVRFPFPYPRPLRIATYSPDGRAVLLGGADRRVRLFRLPDGAPLSHWLSIGGAQPRIVISPNGRYAGIRYAAPIAEIWDLHAGKRVAVLRHREPVAVMVFSPDSRRMLTGSMDATARIWSTATGRPTTPPLVHPSGWVVGASFSADGAQVVTVGGVILDRGEARLWDSRSGEALSPTLEHPRTISSAAFSPNGTRIITAGTEGLARIWSTEPDRRPLGELNRLATLLSGIRFAKDGSPEPVDGYGLSRLFHPGEGP